MFLQSLRVRNRRIGRETTSFASSRVSHRDRRRRIAKNSVIAIWCTTVPLPESTCMAITHLSSKSPLFPPVAPSLTQATSVSISR